MTSSHSFHATIAEFIARLHPEMWDWVHPHGPMQDLGSMQYLGSAFGPHPEPWREAMLHLQPIQPGVLSGERYAITLADATLAEVVSLSRTGRMFGDEAQANMQKEALRLVADFEETCPRWPKWPKRWPPPPHPWERGDMVSSELFFAGARFVGAAGVVEDARVQEGLAAAGGRLMDQGLNAKG